MMYCREIGILAVGNKKVTPLVLKKIFIANERKEKMLHFK